MSHERREWRPRPDAGVAVVTGAGSGLGRAIARRLLEHGYRVALLGRRADALAETAEPAAPVQAWRDGIDVNLTGTFLCCREAFRIMRDQFPQGGRIINNGSISAHVPRPGQIAYAASKHAVTGLTRSLALAAAATTSSVVRSTSATPRPT